MSRVKKRDGRTITNDGSIIRAKERDDINNRSPRERRKNKQQY
jgi:hypothetical protein